MNKIDLQLISQNLLNTNEKLNELLKEKKTVVSINGNKLINKYPQSTIFKDNCIIKFVHGDNGIYTILPYAVSHDNSLKVFYPDNKSIENFKVINYHFSEKNAYLTIEIDDTEVVIDVRININCIKKIRNNNYKPIIGDGIPDLNLLEEKIIFIPIKELPLGQYQVIKNHGKKSKIYDDLLLDVRDLKSEVKYPFLAINTELSKLVNKYNLDCKFEVIGHENFLNKDNKDAVKTLIKDLNFKEDLSELVF